MKFNYSYRFIIIFAIFSIISGPSESHAITLMSSSVTYNLSSLQVSKSLNQSLQYQNIILFEGSGEYSFNDTFINIYSDITTDELIQNPYNDISALYGADKSNIDYRFYFTALGSGRINVSISYQVEVYMNELQYPEEIPKGPDWAGVYLFIYNTTQDTWGPSGFIYEMTGSPHSWGTVATITPQEALFFDDGDNGYISLGATTEVMGYYSAQTAASPIPEPSTLMLLGSSLACLIWHKKNRRLLFFLKRSRNIYN